MLFETLVDYCFLFDHCLADELVSCNQGRRKRGGSILKGRGAISPLPFNIPKTRGHRGQIVPFEICLTEIFLDLLYI